MCGIAGFCGKGSLDDLVAMGNQIIHRGPDGEGKFIDHKFKVFLIHRRLSIIDIESGSQPMWNEDGTIGIVFNGEIYNHLELRKILIDKGHLFRSNHSDTEVLIHGYEEWGKNLPLMLNGMFSFCIYDISNRKLFLSRDRFGKKPLFYYKQKGLFIFSSEVQSLLKHSFIKSSLKKLSLQKYFAYGFLPSPNSFYENIFKLPGGHWAIYDLNSDKLHIQEYWKFKIEPIDTIPKNPEKVWGEELQYLLSNAVKRRLMSDVPLGIFLSGGIDSSAVLAFATKYIPPNNIQTFSIGFTEPTFDESAFARRIAEYFGTNHHNETLNFDKAKDLVPFILNTIDEPLGDPSIIPTYQLCKFSRKFITVALSGDGGDELFAGYDPFKALKIANFFYKFIPSYFKQKIQTLVNLLPISTKNMSFDFKIKRGLRGVSYPPYLWNPIWLAPLDPKEIRDLFNDPIDINILYEEAISIWDNSISNSLIDKTLEFYSRLYLQDNILTKADRASMLVSLEVRSPFLDNDVVEFARKIPFQYKLHHGITKYILKKSLDKILPEDILYRKKKGFGIPLTGWLREWEYSDFNRYVIPNTSIEWTLKKLSEHKKEINDYRHFLWCWLTLQYNKSLNDYYL